MSTLKDIMIKHELVERADWCRVSNGFACTPSAVAGHSVLTGYRDISAMDAHSDAMEQPASMPSMTKAAQDSKSFQT